MSTPPTPDDYKTWQRACPFCFVDLHGDDSCTCAASVQAARDEMQRKATQKSFRRIEKQNGRAVKVVEAAESAAAAGASTPLDEVEVPIKMFEYDPTVVYSITKECRLPAEQEMAASVKGVSWTSVEAMAHLWMAACVDDVNAMLDEAKTFLDALTTEEMRLPNRNRIIFWFTSKTNPIIDEETGETMWSYRLIIAKSVKKILTTRVTTKNVRTFTPRSTQIRAVVGSDKWGEMRGVGQRV